MATQEVSNYNIDGGNNYEFEKKNHFLFPSGVAELEEGDCLELEPRPPVSVKTDNSYANVFKNLEELGK